MSGPNERDEIAALMEAHRISHHRRTIEGFQLCRCTCGWTPNCFHFGGWERCDRNHRVHVADALTDLLAERDRRTAATAVREAAEARDLRLSGHSGISIRRLRDRAHQIERGQR